MDYLLGDASLSNATFAFFLCNLSLSLRQKEHLGSKPLASCLSHGLNLHADDNYSAQHVCWLDGHAEQVRAVIKCPCGTQLRLHAPKGSRNHAC